MKRIRIPKPILWMIAAGFWTAVWYLAAFRMGNELFLPYPHTVLASFWKLLQEGDFWRAVWQSMQTVLKGALIGCVLGGAFAVFASLSRIFCAIISPLVTVLRATPVASFIILVYVIVRVNGFAIDTVALLIVIIMVIPILYSNLYSGISSFNQGLDEVARVYSFSFRKKIVFLWFPQLKPFLISGVINAIGFAWKAGVAAEVICNLENTIGQNLAESKSNLEMDRLFAWTVTVVLLSVFFECLIKRAFQKKRKGRAVL
ncbi:MAG: ABC transporter permease subunit [Clostridia bacterium]|nr:ABC transporter permease subunit [Clostridia bacterium]